MLRFRHNDVGLDLVVCLDESSGLPLLEEQGKILDLIRAYLALPYTIAEYGCGRKCSIILHKLMALGIPPYALKRGMIMEQDMSDKALQQTDFTKRPHALIIENPLYHPKDFYKEILFSMLDDKLPAVTVDPPCLQVGSFVLHHHRELQFVQARSHIFPVITFWNNHKNRAEELVLDPTINAEALIEIEELRDILHDEEALLFTAPLMGKFRLDDRYLTYWHRHKLQESKLAPNMQRLPKEKHDDFILLLNGASSGSIGDPATWTYANNLHNDDPEYTRQQLQLTGKGDIQNYWLKKLISARKEQRSEVLEIKDRLIGLAGELQLYQQVREDARRAEKALAPLAQIELIIAYYRASRQLFNWWRNEMPLTAILRKPLQLEKVAGISMRVRRRIEKLAEVSMNPEGKIDARALSDRFINASLETIRQMNEAGLKVFVDRVGNIHGWRLSGPTFDKLSAEGFRPTMLRKIASRSICHCSHIDTVFDGGKYDGRLGVLAGIEMAHIFADLEHYFGMNVENQQRHLMVSAYIGEEMTYTGEEVSMPGSSAVAGLSTIDEVYRMTNDEDQLFRDGLLELLRQLKREQQAGTIILVNDFSEPDSDAELLNACFDPRLFFSPHTYERHIEQGPVLDRHKVPMALVDTIMGIHQEDFTFIGEQAESGALAFNLALRRICSQDKFSGLRVTVGMLRSEPARRMARPLDVGVRVRLRGELNHAGATLMQDRRDPGVAIARLMEYFRQELPGDLSLGDLEILVGDIQLEPGANRNVIPGRAMLTLGVVGSMQEGQLAQLNRHLQSWIIDHLTAPVTAGGEGIYLEATEPIDFVSLNREVLLSVDLRYAEEATKVSFLEAAYTARENICREYDLESSGNIAQQLTPFHLAESGQVLQLERSYGGSHNPDEAQLDRDLLLGSLLQLEVSRQFLRSSTRTPDRLYALLDQFFPEEWKRRLPRFISGALHDTCNIAARVSQTLQKQKQS